MNPFELARAELYSTRDSQGVFDAIDALLRDGFTVGDKRYRLFGGRIGRAFSMSLGLPFLGGGAPVIRGRVREGIGLAVLDITVGARHEFMLFGWFWALLTVLGGGYQLWLQVRRVLAGEATSNAVLEVLPGIALMAGIVVGGVAFWRFRQRPQAGALIEVLRQHVGATAADAVPRSFSPRAIN